MINCITLRRFTLVSLPLLGSAALSPAYAIDFGAGMVYQYESSDNIDRVADTDGPEDGIRQTIAGNLSASTRGKVLDMDLDLSLGFSESDGVEDDPVTDFQGGIYGLFNLKPGQISWLFADYVVQQGEDISALSDPDERFLANYFVTGPSTSWRLTPVDTANVDLFYLLADEEGETEQTRQLALQTDWSHRFSRRHAFGLHYEKSDIGFKESDDEFGIVNTYGRYSYTHGKTLVNLDVGKSSSTDESADEETAEVIKTTTDEDLFRFGLSRQMSRELSLSLNGSQVFTDETMSTIRDLQANLNGGLNTGTGPFYEKRLALGLARGGDIWNAGLTLSNTAIEFVDTASQVDDRATKRAAFELGYSLSSVWGLSARAGVAEIDYDNIVRLDEETNYGLGVSFQFAASWGVALDADYSVVDSNRPNSITGIQEDETIEENGVTLSLYWQPQTKLSRLREKYERKQIENVLE